MARKKNIAPTIIVLVFAIAAMGLYATGFLSLSTFVDGNTGPPNGSFFVITDSDYQHFTGISEIDFDDGQGTVFTHYVTVDGKVKLDFVNERFCSKNLRTSSGTNLYDVFCYSRPPTNEEVFEFPELEGQCVVIDSSSGNRNPRIVPCREDYEIRINLPEISPGEHTIGVYRLSDYGIHNGQVFVDHDVRGSVCRGGNQDCQAVCPSGLYVGLVCVGQGQGGQFLGRTAIWRGTNRCPQLCDETGNPLAGFETLAEFDVFVPGGVSGAGEQEQPEPDVPEEPEQPEIPEEPIIECGNNVCDSGETTVNCSVDCPMVSDCGDNTCSGNETFETCPQDCEEPVQPEQPEDTVQQQNGLGLEDGVIPSVPLESGDDLPEPRSNLVNTPFGAISIVSIALLIFLAGLLFFIVKKF